MGPAATRDLSGIELRLIVQNNQRASGSARQIRPRLEPGARREDRL